MKLQFVFAGLVCCAMILAGCRTMEEEKILPANVKLDRLEKDLLNASDPHALYRKASSFILRQKVSEKRFLDDPDEYIYELKYKKPNFFKATKIVDNQPEYAAVFDGVRGFFVDYRKKEVTDLNSKAIDRMRSFVLLASPENAFSKVFPSVELKESVTGDRHDYLLDCRYSNDPERKNDSVKVYIDKQSFLIRRTIVCLATPDGSIRSDSKVLSYALRDGVMLPIDTQTTQNGQEQSSHIIYFKLDPVFAPHEFDTPVFR